MDEIEKRLRDATDNCIKFHEGWRKDQKDGKARENLLEAVHELRKVAARMEIAMAISERDEMAAKPIPIPPHRASRKRPGSEGDDVDSISDGNQAEQPQMPQRAHGGSHGGGGGLGHRRRPPTPPSQQGGTE